MSSKYGRRDSDDEMYEEKKREPPPVKESYRERGTYHHSRKPRYPLIAMEIVNISEKITVPTKEYPKYNFLGKILGPKGSILKGIAASTKSKISILGRGSTKDLSTEEELSKSDSPEHQHLKEPLHVLIQVRGPKVEAHARMSTALKELNKFMVPTYETKQINASVASMGAAPVASLGAALPPMGSGPTGPILRFGIPPPGAIIIGQANMATAAGSHREQKSPRSMDVPKRKSDSHIHESTSYNGYSETKDPVRYKYADVLASPRQGEKRTTDTYEYATKKYRDESYHDSSYGAKEDTESYYATKTKYDSDAYYTTSYKASDYSTREATDYLPRDNYSKDYTSRESRESRESSNYSSRQGEYYP